jgi:hypothetical protein
LALAFLLLFVFLDRAAVLSFFVVRLVSVALAFVTGSRWRGGGRGGRSARSG